MKTTKIFALIGLLLATFVSSAQKPRYIKTDQFEGVAFGRMPGMSPARAKTTFMPAVKDIIKMEKKICDSLVFMVSAYEKSASLRYSEGRETVHCNIIENLKKYKRCYSGSIWDGKKMIVTIFYLYVPENWKEEIYYLLDERRCEVFRVSYDVKSGRLFNFFTDLSPM